MTEASTPKAHRKNITLDDIIIDTINTAVREKPSNTHILVTISRTPVLWNEQYKAYFKYSYIVDTPHRVPILVSPLDPQLRENLGLLESRQYMKVPTHSVSLYVRNRRELTTGEIVRVVEVDMVPKYRGYHAADEEKAKRAGKEENTSHGVGAWLRCKGRKQNVVCDCVLDTRTVWDDPRVITIT